MPNGNGYADAGHRDLDIREVHDLARLVEQLQLLVGDDATSAALAVGDSQTGG
jgi:hypothetical protein